LDELVSERETAEKTAEYVRANGLSTARVQVREQRTYRKGGEHSFFRDAFSTSQSGLGAARERIERHIVEAEREGELTERALATGGASGLVIPQYLINQYALIARAGRPTANLVQRQDLPAEGMSIIIPRSTTGASAAVQNPENTAASSTDEVWALLTVPIVTIAGQNDVSTQLLTRGGAAIDEIIFEDIAGAYTEQLDLQVLSGTGSSGQMLGLLNTAGINTATAFGAAPSATNVYSKVLGQVNAVQQGRKRPADTIIMAPRRVNWLLNQMDSAGRPLVVPGGMDSFNGLGGAADDPANYAVQTLPAATFAGLPVYMDYMVPQAVGTNSEDQIIVLRRRDAILWEENGGLPKQIRFDQTLGGQLTTKLVAYGFAAFTAGRYPAAVGVVGGLDTVAGDGLIAPTF
ncbi:MAG: phage major capsid protein, partial [Propionibacterium sp.]|nr:phage major capsid protein [Propionibacterium sp.]